MAVHDSPPITSMRGLAAGASVKGPRGLRPAGDLQALGLGGSDGACGCRLDRATAARVTKDGRGREGATLNIAGRAIAAAHSATQEREQQWSRPSHRCACISTAWTMFCVTGAVGAAMSSQGCALAGFAPTQSAMSRVIRASQRMVEIYRARRDMGRVAEAADPVCCRGISAWRGLACPKPNWGGFHGVS